MPSPDTPTTMNEDVRMRFAAFLACFTSIFPSTTLRAMFTSSWNCGTVAVTSSTTRAARSFIG